MIHCCKLLWRIGKVTSNTDPCFTPEIFISWKNKITCLGLTLIMTFFSQIVLDTHIWVSFEPMLEWHQNEGLGMSHIIILNTWSQKGITNLKKKHSYWIWSFYNSWNRVYKYGSFVTQFWLYDVTRIVKISNFGKNDEKSNFSPQKK